MINNFVSEWLRQQARKYLKDIKMTPCEKKGYRVGDRFKVISKDSYTVNFGDIVTLVKDDDTYCPYFSGSSVNIFKDKASIFLDRIEKINSSQDVQSPSHYNQGEVECIVAIKAAMTPLEFQGYLKGNAMKYLWRMGLKGKPLVDVQKAQWYVNKLVEELNAEAK